MDDYGLDLEEVFKVIDSAEVLIVRFAIIDKRLLIDSRTSASEGPLIALVPKANSIEERFKSLKQMRPRFPLPDKIMSFMWHRPSMETFRKSGIWQRITDRLVMLGGDNMASECERVFEELQREERAEIMAAIRGSESYQSLWERGD
ncbi:MAG TPA: hypothetical protein VNL15_02770 [Dehalococcoidia bacterium]|nr:hypothetical protein [Dehalococcoidia bacterium]